MLLGSTLPAKGPAQVDISIDILPGWQALSPRTVVLPDRFPRTYHHCMHGVCGKGKIGIGAVGTVSLEHTLMVTAYRHWQRPRSHVESRFMWWAFEAAPDMMNFGPTP